MSAAASAAELAQRLRQGDLSAAPAVLNLVETTTPEARAATAGLLHDLSPEALGHEAEGHIIGITGPPGVGKSTLLSRLAAGYRTRGQSVAVLAVDPSSRRTGGSLLGDRARIAFDPTDRAVFIRSTAAGERLGGLAPATRAAASALAVAFDIVVIETVGVGQSETEVAELADSVAVIVQPGSGDVLQFLKSGIMETPDVLVVTKVDLGRVAQRAMADLHAALRSVGAPDTRVLGVCAIPPVTGVDQLIGALDEHRASLDLGARRLGARRAHALADFVEEHGARGLRAVGRRRAAERWLTDTDPRLDVPALTRALEAEADSAR